ncbi:hypothetical protein HB780_05535 (plasmid) [Rhizobium lusitanum]|uniref:hypothetical protein n=1 Tax=Rhizobium lusitanum TaxID=293958 RepID=UPI00160F079D|nr:hypothetical protein [Rhizobium lusitanum]QND45217.1 hypothetical protein HB780_05535 [Rhizobium lusitanum]
MRRMILVTAAASMLALTLSSCVTSKVDDVNATVQEKLEAYCPKVEQAHTTFVLITWVVDVPQSVKDAEKVAYETAETFCADPASVTVQTAPQKVIDALDAINRAKAKTGS